MSEILIFAKTFSKVFTESMLHGNTDTESISIGRDNMKTPKANRFGNRLIVTNHDTGELQIFDEKGALEL